MPVAGRTLLKVRIVVGFSPQNPPNPKSFRDTESDSGHRPQSDLQSGEKKTNKHKQLCGIVPEMGGGQIVYVFPLFLGKKGNT